MKQRLAFLFCAIAVFAFFVYAVVVFFVKKNAPRDLSEMETSGILHVVTEYDSVNYYVSGDTIAGEQYDLCRYIEKRSGLKIYVSLENNWEVCLRKLNKGVYDVIAQNIPITSESRELVSFTVPVVQSKQVLVQRKSLPGDSFPLIRNQIDLAGQTVYVAQASPCILRLRNLSDEIAEPIYIKEVVDYTAEQLIYMVAYKEIDYAIVDKQLALKNQANFPDIDVATDISFTQNQAWAVRKTSPVLLDSLNQWIGEWNALKTKN
ncbi:MAG: transporter substrate-binding domain-containing protein [Dysgonamonadaceae bacterium]|jgi:membrane-bound lytic murein transglycosylase MltF|nr:transporter substrate-binding domain-containing protein [Dysgonamonadaceae bacterium]